MTDENTYQQQLSQQEQEEQQQLAELYAHTCCDCGWPIEDEHVGFPPVQRQRCNACSRKIATWVNDLPHLSDSPVVSRETQALWDNEHRMCKGHD